MFFETAPQEEKMAAFGRWGMPGLTVIAAPKIDVCS